MNFFSGAYLAHNLKNYKIEEQLQVMLDNDNDSFLIKMKNINSLNKIFTN